MEPLISVIVPVYKVEPYLRQCVDSILAQTYTNLEIILVDDGSPDHCGAICDEYAEKDRRVQVIHKPNGGAFDARNAGFDIATGEYLSFVDSDDYLSEYYVKQLMEGHPFDICFSGCTVFEDKTECYYSIHAAEKSERYVNGLPFNTEKRLIKCSLFGYSWAKIYRAEIIKMLRFQDIVFREDLVFNLDASGQWESVYISPSNGYFYRQHNNSILHQHYNKPVPNITDTARKLIVGEPRFKIKERRFLSNALVKAYITDMLSVCIMRNPTLTSAQRFREIEKVFSDKTIYRLLRVYHDDNKLFLLFVLCYKAHFPYLYYFLLNRGCNE